MSYISCPPPTSHFENSQILRWKITFYADSPIVKMSLERRKDELESREKEIEERGGERQTERECVYVYVSVCVCVCVYYTYPDIHYFFFPAKPFEINCRHHDISLLHVSPKKWDIHLCNLLWAESFPPTKFIYQSPNVLYLRIWLYLEIGSLNR